MGGCCDFPSCLITQPDLPQPFPSFSLLNLDKNIKNILFADKYFILSDLYDKDTRKKGSKKKKLDYTKQKKTPSLMEPIIIADLKGEWGFGSNKFPITGKKNNKY